VVSRCTRVLGARLGGTCGRRAASLANIIRLLSAVIRGAPKCRHPYGSPEVEDHQRAPHHRKEDAVEDVEAEQRRRADLRAAEQQRTRSYRGVTSPVSAATCSAIGPWCRPSRGAAMFEPTVTPRSTAVHGSR